jgi:hypothetical protein
MNGRDFLVVAKKWSSSRDEAELKSAVSRAYYAAFHVARQLFEDLHFVVPQADRAHKYLSFRLSNCGDPLLEQAGYDLDDLRSARNLADYNLRRPLAQTTAASSVQIAERIVRTLDGLVGPRRNQVYDAIRVYERDALGEITWRP